eukprot:gene15725-biopygen24754
MALDELIYESPVNQRETVAAGAIPLLVALLSAGTRVGVQKSVCRALVALAFKNPDHQQKLAAGGAIPPLVELSSTRTSSSVQEQAAETLGLLNLQNPDKQQDNVAAGALLLMVALLSAGTTAGVQETVCGVLLLLDPGNPVIQTINRSLLQQENAAEALYKLIYKNPDNQRETVAAGALPLMVALLSAGNTVDVQKSVCRALGDLATGSPAWESSLGALPGVQPGSPSYWDSSLGDLQQKLAAAGAIPPLVEFLSTSTPASVQLPAAMALLLLNHQNPENQLETVAAGALPLMVALLSAGTTAGVLERVCSVLGDLATGNPDLQRKLAAADNPENQLETVAAGALPLMVALLSAGTAAAEALGELIYKNPDNQQEIVAAGALPLMVVLLSAGTTASVQENVCWVLAGLAYGNPDHQRKLAAAGC